MYNYIIHKNKCIIPIELKISSLLFKYNLFILAHMMNEYQKIIKNIPPLELAKIAKVTRDTAQKYKSGYTLPPLKKAFLIEDALGIPARTWIELQEQRENNK